MPRWYAARYNEPARNSLENKPLPAQETEIRPTNEFPSQPESSQQYLAPPKWRSTQGELE
jgi:hypothetical protein